MPSLRPSADGVARWLATVALVAVCVLVASTVGPWEPRSRGTSDVMGPGLLPSFPAETPAPRPPLGEPATREPVDLSGVGRVAVVVVTVVLLALLARWLLDRWRSLRPPEPASAPTDPGVAVLAAPDDTVPDARVLEEGARAAQRSLQDAPGPAEGVIAAWVALEQAAGRSGVTRLPSATPTEFTVQVLGRTAADGAAARTLLTLYLRARFDDAPLSPDDAATAAQAAGDLVRSLAGSARTDAPARWGDPR